MRAARCFGKDYCKSDDEIENFLKNTTYMMIFSNNNVYRPEFFEDDNEDTIL